MFSVQVGFAVSDETPWLELFVPRDACTQFRVFCWRPPAPKQRLVRPIVAQFLQGSCGNKFTRDEYVRTKWAQEVPPLPWESEFSLGLKYSLHLSTARRTIPA